MPTLKTCHLLESALSNSLSVISAWDNNLLVGLLRVVGDGLPIIYVQDLLVLKEYQNKGIGTQLITRVLSDYKQVRQKVLLTNEEPKVRYFYESHGFISCDQGSLVAFTNLD